MHAHCAKCDAELIGARKFCAACGSPVAPLERSPSANPPASPSAAPPATSNPSGPVVVRVSQGPSPVNPFAATASPISKNPISAVSPLAMSGTVEPIGAATSQKGTEIMGAVPWRGPSDSPTSKPASETSKRTQDRTQLMGAFPPSPQSPQAPASHVSPTLAGFSPGARVQVTWSNGQRYTATVRQVSGTRYLVAFPDGQQHWVEGTYVAGG